jgi:hypothetical protein
MKTPEVDERSPSRQARDEHIAAEPPLPPLELPANASTAPVEAYLARFAKRPLAIVGVVENGLVRPLDPTVKLTEHTRVIIVATEQT